MKVETCNLKAHPNGPISKDHFEYTEQDVDLCVEEGQVLVQLLDIAIDAYMRVRCNKGPLRLLEAFKVGEPIESSIVARVVESKHADYKEGSLVVGMLPLATFQVVSHPTSLLQNVPPIDGVPSSYFIGILGVPGLSAYLPFQHYAKNHLTEESVVMVSGAAGGVGSVFGQLCKAHGCKFVYGSTGSDKKAQDCQELFGYDKVFNYKKDGIAKGIDTVLDGKKIDVFFDNVGGEMLDEVILRMNDGGTIICCGAVSQYNETAEPYGLKNTIALITSRITVHGFLVAQWLDEFPQALQELAKMISDKRIHPHETILHGFQSVVDGIVGLFHGENVGKMIVTLEN